MLTGGNQQLSDSQHQDGIAFEETRVADTTKPLSLTDGTQFRELYSMAMRDFDQCATTVRANVQPSKRESVLLRLALEVCLVDLANYGRAVAHIQRAEDKRTLGEAIISAWTKRDPGRLLAFADQSLAGTMKNSAYRGVIQLLCDRGDRDAAIRAFERMPLSMERSSLLGEIAHSWKPERIQEALRWAAGMEHREDRLTVIERLTDDAERDERLDALEKLARVAEDPAVRKRIATRLATLKAQNEGSAAASAWLDSLPRGQRTAATLGIITGIAGKEPEAATRLGLALPDGPDKNIALSFVLNSALHEDPEKAARWVLTLPTGGEQREMMRHLASGWYDMDSMALSDWVNKLERGPLRDEALDSMARKLIRSDRDAAYQVAQAIQDEKRRNAFFKAHQP